MNECLDNDDDEEAPRGFSSCFFTTLCVSGSGKEDQAILPSFKAGSHPPVSACNWYKVVFLWIQGCLKHDGLMF
jgi:hypothetical protein